MPKVKFLKDGKVTKEIEVAAGANLRAEALKAQVSLYAGLDALLNCRGFGMCATCVVYLKNGTAKNAAPRGFQERIRAMMGFWDVGHEEEARLACKTTVQGDLDVETTPPYNWFGEPAKK
ncbi:MAG: (2Fe-2S)-binding protein [Planctomycetes bacterium]|nr:(2Fe-2S)-binding protein [Planctomycetota bacterium]